MQTVDPKEILKLPSFATTEYSIINVPLTMELAARLVSLDYKNRPPRKKSFNAYARDMVAGNWRLNAETMKLDTDGYLFDGHNRCLARIIAGLNAPDPIMSIAFGVSPDARGTVNRGNSKTLPQFLAADREVYVTQLAAGLGWIWRIEKRIPHMSEAPTVDEGYEILNRYPDIRECLPMNEKGRSLMPLSILAAVHVLVRHYDKNAADAFFSLLLSGEGLRAGDPILALRNRLLSVNMKRQSKLNRALYPALLIKTWNAAVGIGDRDGKPNSKGKGKKELQYMTWSPEREGFPELFGM